MKPKKTSRVSVSDIAAAADVSKATAGYVLRNQAGPSAKTREKVWKVARRLGYAPDPRLATWMMTVRGAKSKRLLPIAWLNTHAEKDAWEKYAFTAPYRLGMIERCGELGYHLEEIWLGEPGMTVRRVSQILYQRGIEGVVVTPPAAHLRLDWERLAGINLGTELLAPRLHRVIPDFLFNLRLALKMVRRAGYRRVGLCVAQALDRASSHMAGHMAWHLASEFPASGMVPPCFYEEAEAGPPNLNPILSWVRANRVDAVLCHDNRLVEWLQMKYRVPQDIGVAHLAIDDDVLDWTGIYSNRRQIGRTGAELVISLVQNRQFGIPGIGLDTVVRGVWRNGRTLLVPRSK